jgi:hypothetical protein
MTNLLSFYDYTQSLESAQAAIEEFKAVYIIVKTMRENQVPVVSKKNGLNFLQWWYIKGCVLFSLRPDEQHTEYQRLGNSVERMYTKDRIFPLDTVELQRFRTNHGADIGDAVIHTGPYADEYARSLNALAVTIGADIFFRNNAFNTSTEEGKKTLAHELTHVTQYEGGRMEGNSSIEELEEEAFGEEKYEGYNGNPYCVLKFGKTLCRIREKEIDAFITKLADVVEKRIAEQKDILREEDYFKLLVEYEAWLKEGGRNGLLGA